MNIDTEKECLCKRLVLFKTSIQNLFTHFFSFIGYAYIQKETIIVFVARCSTEIQTRTKEK
jgi:hypothetical protein